MRVDIRRFISAMLVGGALCWSTAVGAQEPQEERALFLLGDGLEFQYDVVRGANFQPEQPLDPGPIQPLDPGPTQPLDTQGIGSTEAPFSSLDAISDVLDRIQAPSAEAIVAADARMTGASDLGQIIQESDNVQTVGTQRRSQVAFDPRIRGYHYTQIYAQAEGEYFLPARLDLDSMLNKIDPSLIQSATVVPGPYGVTMGPGFAFIDIDLIDTPRYCDCPQTHGRAGFDVRSNGGQTAEKILAMGGGSDYGYILHYGHRIGSDYRSGSGFQVPSSYQAQNVLMQFGFDVSPYTKTEIRYSHLNVGPTEYYLQFFDISTLRTNSLNVVTTTEDPCNNSTWVNQIWTNATDFRGNNFGPGKRSVRERVVNALNFDLNNNVFPGNPPGNQAAFDQTDFVASVAGDVGSHGARTMKTYGDDQTNQLKVGADFRLIAQSTREDFAIQNDTFNPQDPDGFLAPDQENFFTELPRSVMTDPGLFVQMSTPWTSYYRTTVGGRVDFVNTHRPAGFVAQNQAVTGDTGNARNDVLAAGFLATDIDLTSEWSARLGAGYAERVPNLVDRYSDGVFVSMIQSGFSKIIGQTTLNKERATQVDASLKGEYEFARVRASAFYSWINDFNTYFSFGVDPPTGAALLVATNTPLATLQGFEVYGDYDLNEQWSVFGTLQYVEGTDETIALPLPGIYPMESRIGLRCVDECGGETWGWEWGWRLVDRQTRAGFLRDADANFIIGAPVRVEYATPGFVTSYLRGYYNYSEGVHFVAGIDNLFDRNYVEHLDLRIVSNPQTQEPSLFAFAPGFNAYGGVELIW